MVFNGHTQESIDNLDEETFKTICVMYADGILGNHSVINTLGTFVNGVFNYIRPPNTAAYSLKSILNQAYGYLYQDVEYNVNDALALFISQAPDFKPEMFGK